MPSFCDSKQKNKPKIMMLSKLILTFIYYIYGQDKKQQTQQEVKCKSKKRFRAVLQQSRPCFYETQVLSLGHRGHRPLQFIINVSFLFATATIDHPRAER